MQGHFLRRAGLSAKFVALERTGRRQCPCISLSRRHTESNVKRKFENLTGHRSCPS